jgi:hypothetical protein
VYAMTGEYYASDPSLIIHLLSCMYKRSHIILTLWFGTADLES